jgi:hypothetical protein
MPLADPIFEDFSRKMNRTLQSSLTNQDNAIKDELSEKMPKELEKQISDDLTDEKILEAQSSTESAPSEHRERISSISEKDLDAFIEKIAFDSEHVERVHTHDSPLKRQDNINSSFDEFSRDFNKQIKKSLNEQDQAQRQELMKKIPKIEELEKQLSDDVTEEIVQEKTEKNPHLLAPICSIDSTSSDEDRKAQLSIVAEESEASDSLKKKSFDEPSIDIADVESLKNDGESDGECTLVDDTKPSTISITTLSAVEIKEDVPLKENDDAEETKIKISPKWAKMR